MNEKEINEIVNEHYGFTIEEIDEDLGKALLRIKQLEYNNEKLQQENNQLKKEYYKQIEEYQKACDEVTSDKMDLENILKELRSWLKDFADYSDCIKIISVLNKLNELEGKNG